MKKTVKITGYVGLISSAMLVGQAVQADVLYNNTTTSLNTKFNALGSEIGDQIDLSSTGGGTITNFTFEYYLSGVGNTLNDTAQVRLYKNDGAPFNGNATPGTVLFDSGSFSLAGFTRDGNGIGQINFNASNDAAFALWNGIVPQEFTWSIKYSGLDGTQEAGLTIYDPPSVGNGFDDYWDNDGTGWQLRTDTVAPITPLSFGASFEGIAAVPEPTTLMLGALGGILAIVSSRRNRRS